MKKFKQTISRSFILALVLIVASCESTLTPHSEGEETSVNLSPMKSTAHTGTTPTEYEIIDLGTLGGNFSGAYGINDAGQVVGESRTSSGETRAFLWDAASGMRDLGTLGGNFTLASGINDAGQVVGESRTSSGETRAFLWDAASGMRDLGTLSGNFTAAYGINDAGQVVGESGIFGKERRAFLWDETGGMRDLGMLSGNFSQAVAINNARQVAGVSNTTSGELRAFLWDAASGMRDLGTLGGNFTLASGINNARQVVGTSTIETGEPRAVLWNPVQAETNAPPVADAGLDQNLECAGATTTVSLDGSGSSDSDGDEISYSWRLDGSEIATGSSLQIELPDGTHTITLTVTDPEGAASSDEVTVTVEDTIPPEIRYTAEKTSLWPPNHKMRLVVTGINASEVCDAAAELSVSVASNEPVNGRGDGNTAPDWQVKQAADGSYEVYLRAERSGGGSGRVYTVTITAEDASGNIAEEVIAVSVAHDRRKSR